MKISFTKKEVVKLILKVYLPLLIILRLIGLYRDDFVFDFSLSSIISYFILSLFFLYPTYLLVNLRIKKFFHWFFIGVLPLIILNFISSIKNRDFNVDIYFSIIFANIMYPISNGIIQTLKEYWEMSKEMTWGRKIGLLLSLIFILISILKRARW
jgi:hypothetical protein